MIKLLNANFMRIKKSKIFKILFLSVLLMTLVLIFNQYQNFQHSKSIIQYDSLYNFFLIFIGIVISIFTGMFLGNEYSNGTIRNKIIIGHKRVNIYIANLVTVIIVSLFFEFVYVFLISIIGIPLFGFHIEVVTNFIYTLCLCQLIIIANASIYTFISMISSDAILINIVCILIAFGSYFATLLLMDVVETPQYIQASTITNVETGETKFVNEKNPNYPSKLKREICNTLLHIIPQSQSIMIVSNKISNKNLVVIYSLCTSIIFTGTGLVLFKKKELK